MQRVGPDHLHQHDKDKIGDQIADDLHQQLQNVVDLLDGLGHHFRLSAQHQQRHAHGGAQQDDLQRVARQERTDDIRGEEVQHHAEKTVELRSTAPLPHQMQVEKGDACQNAEGADEIHHGDKVQDHPLADTAEGGHVTDAVDAPCNADEHHGAGDAAQDVEKRIVNRGEEIAEHGKAQRFGQQPHAANAHGRGTEYGHARPSRGLAFCFFSLKTTRLRPRS